MLTSRVLLEDARAMLARPRGWRQGSFGSVTREGSHCALGALRAAAYTRGLLAKSNNSDYRLFDSDYRLFDEAYSALLDGLLEREASVTSFNDQRTTKKKDVLALYDRALEATST